MPVYNYLRAAWGDGERPVDDAPPAVVDAIEGWLAGQHLHGAIGIMTGACASPPLTLLLLHDAGREGRVGSEPGFVHVIAVADRRLRRVSPRALRGLFESLYGGPLERQVPAVRTNLSRLRQTLGTAEALRHFATERDVAGLSWSDGIPLEEAAPRQVPLAAPPPHRGRRFGTALVGVGAVALALGIGVAGGGRLASWLAPSRSADATARVGAASAELAALSARIDALAEELHQGDARRDSELARLEARLDDQLTLLTATQTPPEPESTDDVAYRPGVTTIEVAAEPPDPILDGPTREAPLDVAAAAPPVDPPAPEVAAAPEPAPSEPALPSVASPPPRDAAGPTYRVDVATARVRAAPSSDAPTRGLLPRGARVMAIAEQGEWLEIQPPETWSAPSWIHVSLLARSEDRSAR